MVMPSKKRCSVCGKEFMESDAFDIPSVCNQCSDPRRIPMDQQFASFGGLMDLMYHCEVLDKKDIDSGKAIRCKHCELLANDFIGVTEKGEKKYYCVHCHKITLGLGRTECHKTAQIKTLE